MKIEILRLKEVLIDPEKFTDAHDLYLPEEEEWTLESKCVVAEESAEEKVLKESSLTGRMMLALGMDQVQDIVLNARQQVPEPSEDLLFGAFIYYYDNDAFIKLTV